MSKLALLGRVEAKPDKAEEVEQFLKNAVDTAREEPQTNEWFALKFDDTHFGIFDTFDDESGREEHLNGEIAEALMKNSDELFTKDPVIEKIEVIAEKDG